MKCETCYGSGRVPEDFPCARCGVIGCHKMDCPDCGGTGAASPPEPPELQAAHDDALAGWAKANEQIAALVQQRDELAKTLAALVEQCGHISPFAGKPSRVESIRQAARFLKAYDAARAALAKVTP